MNVRARLVLLAAGGLLIASACADSSSSNSSANDAGAGGASATGCPATSPRDKTACALTPGSRCNYGCEAGGPSIATCTGSMWSVTQLEIACQAPGTDGAGGSAGNAGTGGTGGNTGDSGTGCRKDVDCPTAQYCATNQPGGITYCSTKVNEVKCNVDNDCSEAGPDSVVCENYLCPSGTGRSCFPGCTDAQCGPTDQTGLVCAPNHRCQAKACQQPTDCPTNLDCSAGYCQRRQCTSDAMCQGYCVNGKCGSALGTCERPRG